MKNLEEEIALLLWKRSVRDRMVIELRYFGELKPAEIVAKVKEALPGVRISRPGISRILAKFEDELRPRLTPD